MAVRDFFRLDDDHPFTGLHMLAVVVAFFAVVIAVNVAMAIAATGTFPGLIVANSYVASQNYNRLLAESRAQRASGWRLDVAAPEGLIEVRLSARDGLLIRDLDVTGIAGRPSTGSQDRVLAFAQSAAAYRAADPLPAGQWDVEVEARQDGELVFRERRRIVVRPDVP